jgi:hypothetical protein
MVNVSHATKARSVTGITFVCFRGKQRRRDRGRECSVAPADVAVGRGAQAIFLRHARRADRGSGEVSNHDAGRAAPVGKILSRALAFDEAGPRMRPRSRPVQRIGRIKSVCASCGLHHHDVRVWVFGIFRKCPSHLKCCISNSAAWRPRHRNWRPVRSLLSKKSGSRVRPHWWI